MPRSVTFLLQDSYSMLKGCHENAAVAHLLSWIFKHRSRRKRRSGGLAGILINPAGLQSQVSGINLQPTVRSASFTAPSLQKDLVSIAKYANECPLTAAKRPQPCRWRKI